MRSSTERPEALDKGSIVIAGTHEKEILQAVELSVAMRANGESTAPVPDYQDANVSAKMVRIIQSYTKIVNQNVWRKGTERGADAGL
jgi:UDP-N-acetylglucosamine 2-epimerase (non-hydrolysing)